MPPRPTRRIIPTSKLTADNAGDLELTFHRRVVASATAALTAPSSNPSSVSPLPDSSPPPQTDTDDVELVATDSCHTRSSSKRPSQSIADTPSVESIVIISPTTSDDPSHAPKPKKTKTSMASGDNDLSHTLSGTSIIEIDDIDHPLDERLNKTNPTADIKEFFFTCPTSAWSTQEAHEVQPLRVSCSLIFFIQPI